MSELLGQTLGHYRVVEKIGAGGMGEVYRARDERLGRDVAIKVLHDAVAKDEARLARFEREAKLLASLSHQNIATLFGLEEHEQQRFLVMELAEGETLADRIKKGAIPLNDALPIALQIAEGLETAHEQGIIHRDLKPANVMLSPTGRVKILDFGLATVLAPRSMESDPAESPTLSLATKAGTILGTAAYMSPEQARGQRVDKRTDIWAFGCCIYEALTGQRPFSGETISDTLVELLEREPDWDALPGDAPAAIRTLLRRCLDKDRRRRLRDIGEARVAIADGTRWATGVEDEVASPKFVSWGSRAAVGVGIAVISGLIVGVFVWRATRPPAPRVTRLSITAPEGASPELAISADGTRVVYVSADGTGLLVRALDELEPRSLPNLGSPSQPFISPDGAWIGFFDGLKSLMKVPMSGGPPELVCSIGGTAPMGASWGDDGSIIFATDDPRTGLWRVPDSGGEVEMLSTPKLGVEEHYWPHVLPGARAVLLTIYQLGLYVEPQVGVLDLDSGSVSALFPGSYPMYLPTDHIIFGISGTMRAVGFDPGRLEVSGTSTPVLEHVATNRRGLMGVAVADDGTLAYLPGGVLGVSGQLVWVDRQGNEEPLTAPPGAYMIPRICPEGKRVALDNREPVANIWIWSLEREAMTRFTFGVAAYPIWTPDGRRLIYTSFDEGVGSLSWRASDGSTMEERLLEGDNNRYPSSITPDGSRLVFREEGGRTGVDIYTLSLGSGRPPEPLIVTQFNELNAEISPDGHWLAYRSNQSGRDEVYVRPFPDVTAGLWQISTDGGEHPLWARDGREIFYRGLDGSVLQVPVELQPRFSAGRPTRLFGGRYVRGFGRAYDVSPDGSRFLMIKEGDDTDDESSRLGIVVVQNWFEELRSSVPVH